MYRLIAPGIVAAALVFGLAGCTNPYDPGQRAVGGGLLGAGAGAAIGGAVGGGHGAALGAAIGGASGAVTGAATTPPPPPPPGAYGQGYGYPPAPAQSGYGYGYPSAPPPSGYGYPRPATRLPLLLASGRLAQPGGVDLISAARSRTFAAGGKFFPTADASMRRGWFGQGAEGVGSIDGCRPPIAGMPGPQSPDRLTST